MHCCTVHMASINYLMLGGTYIQLSHQMHHILITCTSSKLTSSRNQWLQAWHCFHHLHTNKCQWCVTTSSLLYLSVKTSILTALYRVIWSSQLPLGFLPPFVLELNCRCVPHICMEWMLFHWLGEMKNIHPITNLCCSEEQNMTMFWQV